MVVSQARGNRFGQGSPPRPNGSFNREKGGSIERDSKDRMSGCKEGGGEADEE